MARWIPAALVVYVTVLLAALPSAQQQQDGKSIFRFDTFGSEQLWTDVLQMQHVIAQNVSPKTALSVGLKVDVDALRPSVIDALKAGQLNLDDPSVTVELLKLNAVVGVIGKVVGANDNLATVGITCALCAEWSESRGGETRRGSVHGRGGLCGVSYAAAVYGRGKRAGSECAGPPRNI